MTRLLKRIKRIIDWLPILWNDHDWDYVYLEKILAYKLSRMATCIEGNDTLVGDKRVAKQIRYAVYLLDRIEKDTEFDRFQDAFDKKWGEATFSWAPHFTTEYANATTPELKAEADKELMECYRAGEKKVDELYDRLFKHMNRYLRRWWD